MPELKKDDKISCFWLPHPKKLGRTQQWTAGKVLDRKGQFVKLLAKVHWGIYHEFWVSVDKIKPFLEEKYT